MMKELFGSFHVADEHSGEGIAGSLVVTFDGVGSSVMNHSSLTEAERETFERLLLQLQSDAAKR